MLSIQLKVIRNALLSIFTKGQQNKSDHFVESVWAGHKKMDLNHKSTCLLHEFLNKEHPENLVDDKTWSDLNMDNVFDELNRTTSSIGSQYLYHQLHKYELKEETLNSRHQQYRELVRHENLRKTIQQSLVKLRHVSACKTARIIFGTLPSKPRFSFIFPLLSFSLLAAIVIGFKFNFVFLIAMGLAAANALIHQHYTPRIAGFTPDMNSLCTVLRTVENISNLEPNNAIPEIQALKNHGKLAKKIRSKIGWLSIDTSLLDDQSALLVEYFNFFFLKNLITFMHFIDEMDEHQESLMEMYKSIGSLDTALALAGYLETSLYHCDPVFVDNPSIEVSGMYHPLLDNPVPNSFAISKKSCLVTGSNMSGKTTFIKTIGVNIILARSLNICFAKTATLPKAIVKTSIARHDSLEEGKSFYFMEVEEIGSFLSLAASTNNYVFLIDEIFRGTNTIERLASATAVLNSLCENNLCFVTTHDIELQELLGNNFEMYHFQELVENQRYFFDYKIQHGICQSGNAINLLELKGYPKQIIGCARTLATKLAKNNPPVN